MRNGPHRDVIPAGHEVIGVPINVTALVAGSSVPRETIDAVDKGNKSYHQLDYILIGKSLAAKNKTVKPYIEWRVQPTRVNQRGKPPRVTKFFKGVTSRAKASDHCPVAIKVKG